MHGVAHVTIACGVILVVASSVVTRDLYSVLAITIYVALLLAPGALVLRDPQPKWALLWTLWSLPFALLAFIDSVPDSNISWQIAGAALGTMFVMLVIVIPIVCFVTKPPLVGAEDLPEARVRD